MSATAILKLQDAGFTKAQVEALAEYLDSQVVTKADLARTEATLRSDIQELRTEIHQIEGSLRAEVNQTKATMIQWMVGLNLGTVGLIFAFIKLLP